MFEISAKFLTFLHQHFFRAPPSPVEIVCSRGCLQEVLADLIIADLVFWGIPKLKTTFKSCYTQNVNDFYDTLILCQGIFQISQGTLTLKITFIGS